MNTDSTDPDSVGPDSVGADSGGPDSGDTDSTNSDDTNVALLVSYDGRWYHGWQRHPGKTTVQGALEAAIQGAFDVKRLIEGSGRTDRGAHAVGQVATVRLPANLAEDQIVAGLNSVLPDDVVVTGARRVPNDFHARKSAIGKTYRYVLWVDEDVPPKRERKVWTVRGPLDVDAMAEAMSVFVGKHDFATFATSAGFERSSTIRTIMRAELTSDLPLIELTFEANAFLYKMVRNLVQTVVKVGEGRRSPADVAEMLAVGDRKAAPGSAPASGLFLDHVHYDPPLFDAPLLRR